MERKVWMLVTLLTLSLVGTLFVGCSQDVEFMCKCKKYHGPTDNPTMEQLGTSRYYYYGR